jgi:hypothetical protein
MVAILEGTNGPLKNGAYWQDLKLLGVDLEEYCGT